MNPPSKKFRIWGIAVFVGLTGLIAVFFIMFLDGIIKDTIEEQGSRAMESQIDIASLSTSLLSQSMDISTFQIANADKLDENLVQASHIKFDFDGVSTLTTLIFGLIKKGMFRQNLINPNARSLNRERNPKMSLPLILTCRLGLISKTQKTF